jgi:hypothetical protein
MLGQQCRLAVGSHFINLCARALVEGNQRHARWAGMRLLFYHYLLLIFPRSLMAFSHQIMAKKAAAALVGVVTGGKAAPKVKAGRKRKAAPKALSSYLYASGVTVSEAYCLELVDGKLASVKVLADGIRQVMKKGKW